MAPRNITIDKTKCGRRMTIKDEIFPDLDSLNELFMYDILQSLVVVQHFWRVGHISDLLLQLWFNRGWLDGSLLFEDCTTQRSCKSKYKSNKENLKWSICFRKLLE